MKSNESVPRARQFIEKLAGGGLYLFDTTKARAALRISRPAVIAALNRLAKQGAIASPARGVYVSVPPEYRTLRCLSIWSSFLTGFGMPQYGTRPVLFSPSVVF